MTAEGLMVPSLVPPWSWVYETDVLSQDAGVLHRAWLAG